MTRKELPTLLLLLIVLSLCPGLHGQDAVPAEMLNRTIYIKAGNITGTAFALDYQGKIYLVTARHVVAGLPHEKATIEIWQDNQWKTYATVRTLFPSSNEVDIAVFETNEKAEKPYQVTTANKGGPTMGQQVWFLGYPWGIYSRFEGGKTVAPFIKRGTMSAIDGTNQHAVVIYIDGFNNPGFSGGPILFWDLNSRSYQIVGVVQGYKEDSAKVLINGQHVDTQLLVNTGILVGYSIAHATEAIEASLKQTNATEIGVRK